MRFLFRINTNLFSIIPQNDVEINLSATRKEKQVPITKIEDSSDVEITLPQPKDTSPLVVVSKAAQISRGSPFKESSTSDTESITSIRSLRSQKLSITRDRSPDKLQELSPPRKSARLSSISERCNSPQLLHPASPRTSVRRRSTRLGSVSSNNADDVATEVASALKLPTIAETPKKTIAKEPQTDGGISETTNACDDDVVNEMAASFVDEFLADEEVLSD